MRRSISKLFGALGAVLALLCVFAATSSTTPVAAQEPIPVDGHPHVRYLEAVPPPGVDLDERIGESLQSIDSLQQDSEVIFDTCPGCGIGGTYVFSHEFNPAPVGQSILTDDQEAADDFVLPVPTADGDVCLEWEITRVNAFGIHHEASPEQGFLRVYDNDPTQNGLAPEYDEFFGPKTTTNTTFVAFVNVVNSLYQFFDDDWEFDPGELRLDSGTQYWLSLTVDDTNAAPDALSGVPAGLMRIANDGLPENQFGSLYLFRTLEPAPKAQWDPAVNDGFRATDFSIEGFCTQFVEPIDPNRQLGGQVHLPILNFQGQDDVCRTWIEVQYIGCDPSKAVLVTWGEPGFCPPQAAGPLKVECTGLLRPGSTWNLLGAQIPTGSKSGILFKFTAQQLSDLGINLGFDDVVADLMCETLFFGVVGDSDDYRRFKKAYNEGLEFAGIPQDLAAGTGVLAVEVLRHCPGDVTPGVEVSSRYNGIAAAHLGFYDPLFAGYGYYVPLIYAEKAGLNTVMYIQNGGLECSSVEIWFKAQDDCLRARICEIFTLAPGESYQWDASDCVGPDWQGSAWLRSSQVMGIAVDIFGRDILMTYIGEPQPFAYVVEDETGELVGIASPTTGEKVAYGPLMYSEYQGWDTGVQVQNLSEVVNAKVKVYFLDRSGDVITTLVDWICPRGSQTFFLPVVADLPGTWVGSIRIESQDWWTPGTNPVHAPDIVGVAQLMKYSDVARTDTQEAIAYNLLPEHKSYFWQIGGGAGLPDQPEFNGGLFSGVGLIAIPSLLKDLDGTGTTSEVAIMNLVAKPGFTDFAIYIFDQNGLLDFVCQKLHSRQVEYIDLQTWGYVNNGFKGSAVISATFWEHDVFNPTGDFVRNLVGLGAVGVERTGTRLGEDVPGDESAGSRGIPFANDFSLTHCPGGFVPACPGQPVTPPGTNPFPTPTW